MPRYSPRTGQLETYQPGPFDARHLYVQWGGTLPGSETWSCGVRMAYTGFEMPETIPAGLITGVNAAIQALHSNVGTKISSFAKLAFVKIARIGTDGKYILAAPGAQLNPVETVIANVAGGAANVVVPNQLAIAVTLATGYSRGLAHKGRFYLPMPTVFPGTDGTGLLSTTDANAIQDQAANWHTAMNVADADYRLAVFSRKAGSPTHRLSTAVHVGRVVDTIRRRRRSLKENYITV